MSLDANLDLDSATPDLTFDVGNDLGDLGRSRVVAAPKLWHVKIKMKFVHIAIIIIVQACKCNVIVEICIF